MKLSKNALRRKRKQRISKKVRGTPLRPRLVVFRSNKHIYVQLVDDLSGTTWTAASTHNLSTQSRLSRDTARQVGQQMAAQAKELNVEQVVFDRNGYVYHGRVQALAEGAREGGLKF
ncbi:MAG: 50S ribosomal protein L18 [Desulfohalobiaceae bacterium]